MHFLPDVYVPCEVCKGKRYNRETLEVRYKGQNIADVLSMTVEEALAFFENIPRIRRKLQTLHDVGLGYMQLGQPATTLDPAGSQQHQHRYHDDGCNAGQQECEGRPRQAGTHAQPPKIFA